jgi:hypothetical protein
MSLRQTVGFDASRQLLQKFVFFLLRRLLLKLRNVVDNIDVQRVLRNGACHRHLIQQRIQNERHIVKHTLFIGLGPVAAVGQQLSTHLDLIRPVNAEVVDFDLLRYEVFVVLLDDFGRVEVYDATDDDLLCCLPDSQLLV